MMIVVDMKVERRKMIIVVEIVNGEVSGWK
jgi:hypothetical protein